MLHHHHSIIDSIIFSSSVWDHHIYSDKFFFNTLKRVIRSRYLLFSFQPSINDISKKRQQRRRGKNNETRSVLIVCVLHANREHSDIIESMNYRCVLLRWRKRRRKRRKKEITENGFWKKFISGINRFNRIKVEEGKKMSVVNLPGCSKKQRRFSRKMWSSKKTKRLW